VRSAPQPWTAELDAQLRALVEQVVNGRGPARLRAWQELLQVAAPHVERWAAGHPVLRAVRLTSEDEARAVLVRVVERLQRGQHETLRAFLARGSSEDQGLRAAAGPATGDLEALERFAAFATLGDDEEEPADGGAHRPPITDLLTLQRIVGELTRFMDESLPAPQRRALQLRLDDASYPEIARDLGLARPAEAEQLVRAAKERLRVAFRAQRERFGLELDREGPPEPG
jgi:hypothetical protein